LALLRAVSFDFHDTVAICPTWFQLEVRQLVSATHAELVATGAVEPGPSTAELDAAYRQLRQEIHVHGDEQDALGCVMTVFCRLGIACREEQAAGVIDTLMRATCADLRPRPGIVEAVAQLAERGLPLGITSNAVYHPFLEWALTSFGLRDRFVSVITSASSGYYKSRPEIYRQTAAALGIAPADLVHVGDSFRFDVLPVRRLGGRAVWLNLANADPPEMGASLIVSSLDGLADRLFALT
jgi:FMN phosphatase YigB (HAD superfamily)